ncbi:regulator of ribonuclease activity A [Arthrobacter silviterrae]|uniref:4-hydroxy-4-methyl-2-oxoglutarate aldolase n=1 Tax=Arthrobacter silviterrae TaxID=2026658 RepID=A0ABX0DEU6_9MICC|nr:ribonuclease E activity regulator RraA [Arthrobacter silviterrae]MDQ0278092.1 regulator of ribonuclease activity A [Arthrobacter silviterrae]NGN85451.1 RraA family protein [Arthrobacter silviterrae]
MDFTTADLYDERGTELDSVSTQFRNFGTRTAFSGPARTIRCFQDNALIKTMLATPGHGAVLVVDGGGSLETALMGDLIATSAIKNDWSGVIINGAIRDSTVINTLPLGVKALGTNPAKSTKTGTGETDTPVRLGNVTITPGKMVYADVDGILTEKSPTEG